MSSLSDPSDEVDLLRSTLTLVAGIPDVTVLAGVAELLVRVDTAYGATPFWAQVRAEGIAGATIVLALSWRHAVWLTFGGRPVAFVGLAPSEYRNGEYELCRVMVDPEWSGRGVGRRCITSALAWLDERHFASELCVFAGETKLISWYERCGYESDSGIVSTSHSLSMVLMRRPAH